MTHRTSTTTSAVIEPDTRIFTLEDTIRRRAYELYEQRGGEHGHDVDDWLQAEEEITEMQGRSADVKTTDSSVTPPVRRAHPIGSGVFAAST